MSLRSFIPAVSARSLVLGVALVAIGLVGGVVACFNGGWCCRSLSEAELSKVVATLEVERLRMDVTSQNIANAHTTHGLDGRPYQRRVVVLASTPDNLAATPAARVEIDNRPAVLVYAPGNPEADAHGMVALPNINLNEEMAEMISASHAYAANLAIVKNAAQWPWPLWRRTLTKSL